MDKQKLTVVGVAALVVVAVAVLVFMVKSATDTGEVANPNAGKPNKEAQGKGGGMSKQQADNLDVEGYKAMLKRNRPELSEAEIQQKADNWWKLKTGK